MKTPHISEIIHIQSKELYLKHIKIYNKESGLPLNLWKDLARVPYCYEASLS